MLAIYKIFERTALLLLIATIPILHDGWAIDIPSNQIFHLKKQTYGYRLPAKIAPQFQGKFDFQNFWGFLEDGKPLHNYHGYNPRHSERSIEEQPPGFYTFHREQPGSFVLYFSTNKSAEEVRRSKYVLLERQVSFDNRLVKPRTSPSEPKLKEFQLSYSPGRVSGLEITNLGEQKTTVGAGANGFNLLSLSYAIDSFQRLAGYTNSSQIDKNDFSQVMQLGERLTQYLAIILARGGMLPPEPSIGRILSRGVTHCGNDAAFIQIFMARFGIAAHKFAASNDWWGHTQNLVLVGDRCIILSAYDNYCLDYCPGDLSIHPGAISAKIRDYHKTRGLLSALRFYDEFDPNRFDGTVYGWLSNINRVGAKILFPVGDDYAEDPSLFTLEPGDKIVFDSRTSSLSSESLFPPVYRSQSIGLAMLSRELSNLDQGSLKIEMPLPISHIRLSKFKKKGQSYPKMKIAEQLGSIKEMNKLLKENSTYSLELTDLPSAGKLDIFMTYNAFMLPLNLSKLLEHHRPDIFEGLKSKTTHSLNLDTKTGLISIFSDRDISKLKIEFPNTDELDNNYRLVHGKKPQAH